jgi:hypothetical protein
VFYCSYGCRLSSGWLDLNEPLVDDLSRNDGQEDVSGNKTGSISKGDVTKSGEHNKQVTGSNTCPSAGAETGQTLSSDY